MKTLFHLTFFPAVGTTESCFGFKMSDCVSVQGLHPLKDLVFVVFVVCEGESFRDLVNLVSCS